MARVTILFYGIMCYFVGVAGLLCIIASLAQVVPFGFLGAANGGAASAAACDIVIVAAWGVIHSGMARPAFKARVGAFIPAAMERSTYVLVAGVTSILLVGLWQPVPGQLWHFDQSAVVAALWALFAFGWAFLLASTFAINHFDLFGLRQVFLGFRNSAGSPQPFVKRAMYRYVRHPIQTGVLIGIWATPSMAMTHFLLSAGFTVYIFVGLKFEEADLVAEHGDTYRAYRRETGGVVPRFGGPRSR